ncbi:hypothetical protein SAMD00019534_083540 [Acytostelium subglobosum LB1]|uniref:hypothetical protein n=1 Tax=Acytostelium subglobosum LB1 TaxID=1410327 RepID=UPI000644EF0E|nr:hypothetical protein SAMD00019534_083540 [Acytostelium subglobosum LB1]GAM25179.1 hypothetical protein SAMD00019534_083540 [Acytostelium subglobosum LB1]|eukprot:XP_012751699.1 hypothetical protein SAMD00019534_083540 [Acytostelium subglobosum LB1]
MFEGFVADLLTRYLGKYIKTLNTENLKIGIWSGNVSLENLELKKRALQNFNNLPFSVKEGFLGKLSIKIPWNNLKTEPVIIIIDRLYVVATPKSQDEWDEEDDALKQKKKLDRLRIYESLKDEKKQAMQKQMLQTSSSSLQTSRNGGQDASHVGSSQPTFTESLRNKIVDNIQISIYNVHIRFEDTLTNPERPYCFGVTLEHLKAQSTNEDWLPTFLHTPHTLVHKLITLQNLSVYWDTHLESPLLQCGNINELVTRMSSLIHSKSIPNLVHNYLLRPVCGSLKLIINKSVIPNKMIPAYTFNFEFSEINLELDSNQYCGIMALVEYFSILKKGEKYRRFKPKNGLSDSKDRWRFAIDSVLSDIRERLSTWKRGFIESRRKHRLEYITLYKQKKKKKILSTDTNRLHRLEALEKEFSFEDLVYFRSLADAELKGEESFSKEKAPMSPSVGPTSPPPVHHGASNVNANATGTTTTTGTTSTSTTSTSSTSTTIANSAGGGGGWFSWLGWGGQPKHGEPQEDDILNNLELTDEQRRALYSTIDYDEHQTTANIVYPKDYVKTRMNFSMSKGSIAQRLVNGNQIGQQQQQQQQHSKSDVVIVLTNVTLKLDKFVESLYFQTILETIHVEDRFTENTVFPILMGPLKNSLLTSCHQDHNNNINNSPNSYIDQTLTTTTTTNNTDLDTDLSSHIEHTDDTTSTLSEYHDTNDTQPLFEMTIQENPLNSDANYYIFIETLPLEVVYSKSILDSVLEFFGNAPSNTLKDIEEAARNQIKVFKDKTTLRIQYELQNHKSIDLDININAPHILVPQSFTDQSAPILVLDLGSFSLNSSTTNKSTIIDPNDSGEDSDDYIHEDLNSLSSSTILSRDYGEINESVPKYLYDLYELQLKNIQFFILSNKQYLPLVNRFDINFSIFKCILQSQTLLTKLKLFGDLPSLNIQLSQQTIEMLIRILDSIAPDDLPPPPSSSNNYNNNNNSNNNNNGINNMESNTTHRRQPSQDMPQYMHHHHSSEDETQNLINTIEQLELAPQDQLPILMIYNTMFEVIFSVPTVNVVVLDQDKPFVSCSFQTLVPRYIRGHMTCRSCSR